MRRPTEPVASEDVVQFDLADATVVTAPRWMASKPFTYLIHAMAEGISRRSSSNTPGASRLRRSAQEWPRDLPWLTVSAGRCAPVTSSTKPPQVGEILMGNAARWWSGPGIIIGRGSWKRLPTVKAHRRSRWMPGIAAKAAR